MYHTDEKQSSKRSSTVAFKKLLLMTALAISINTMTGGGKNTTKPVIMRQRKGTGIQKTKHDAPPRPTPRAKKFWGYSPKGPQPPQEILALKDEIKRLKHEARYKRNGPSELFYFHLKGNIDFYLVEKYGQKNPKPQWTPSQMRSDQALKSDIEAMNYEVDRDTARMYLRKVTACLAGLLNK
jgi:hypothetical protein